MPVFLLNLASCHQPFDRQTTIIKVKGDGRPKDGHIEPVDRLVSQTSHQPAPQALLYAHNKLWAFITLPPTCSLHVNRESRIIPRYLNQPERLNLTQKTCGSKKPWRFLFLVNETRPSYRNWPTDRPRCTISLRLTGSTACVLIPCLRIYPQREKICQLRILERISQFHWAWWVNHLPPVNIEVVTTHLPAGSPWLSRDSYLSTTPSMF